MGKGLSRPFPSVFITTTGRRGDPDAEGGRQRCLAAPWRESAAQCDATTEFNFVYPTLLQTNTKTLNISSDSPKTKLVEEL
jgi:hypothetical protein